jgi:hypothetical protein
MKKYHLLILMAVVPLRLCAARETESAVPVVRLLASPKLDGDASVWANVPEQAISDKDGKALFRLGYDAKNFYARVEVVDQSPLRNSAAQPQEMLKGGDAVAFYFGDGSGGGQRVLLARRNNEDEAYVYRPISKEKKPYVFLSPAGEAAFDYVAPLAGAKSKYQITGGGYVLEVAIPWKSLGLEPAGQIAFDLHVIFSDPAGTTNVGALWWHARGGPGLTVEDLPTEARLYPETWGVARFVDKAPALSPRTATAEGRAAGVPIELNLPRPGRVSVVVLDETGWIVRELVRAERCEKGLQRLEWDGRDRYGEPLPAGKYRWKAILFDGVGSRFVGSVGSSGRPPYRTPDGLGGIGGQHGDYKSLAADSVGIYMGGAGEEGPPAFRKIDPATGQALWKRSAGGFGLILAVATDEGKACLLNRTGKKGQSTVDLIRIDPQTGRDLGKGEQARTRTNVSPEAAIAGFAIAGERAWFSVPAENRIGGIDLGSGKALPDIAVPAPQGLCRLDAERLLVCSGKQVLALKDGKTTPLLAADLEAPRAVCVDADGNVYVSDLGASQQIKKFSQAGKLLSTWGRPGGKPADLVPYDPLAFEKVTGITVGPDGNLWLAEETKVPNRFVKLTTSGRWLEDFCGPVAYNTFGPDLDAPNTVYYNTGKPDSRFIQTRIDYEKYAANPLDPAACWQITAIHDLALGADGKTPNEAIAEVARNGYGHVIVFSGTNGRRYLFRPSKDNRGSAPPGAALWIWGKERWVPAAYLSRDQAGLSWRDGNGDGLMQDDERFGGLPTATFAWIDRDLVLHGFDGTLSPKQISKDGIPDYREGAFKSYLDAGQPSYHDGWTFVSPMADGAVYYAANPGPERHLTFWDRAAENRLIKMQGGRVQWVIGAHSERADFAEFSTVSGIAGVVDDMVIAHNVEPANYLAFTTDGLTLGNVIADETGERPKVGPISINIESFTGLFIKDIRSGKRLLFSVSSGDDRILEVTGPGEVARFAGEVTLDTSLPLPSRGDRVQIPYQNWRGNVIRTAQIDGLDAEWPAEITGLSLVHRGAVIGDIRLRRDDGSLHILANLLDSTPFQDGEGIELRFAKDNESEQTAFFLPASQHPDGKREAKNDKGGAIVQRAGTKAPAKEVQVAVAARWNGLGYRLEAKIPLTLLPTISATRERPVRRAAPNARTGKMDDIAKAIAPVIDLPGSFFFEAAALREEEGTLQRLPWPSIAGGVTTAP